MAQNSFTFLRKQNHSKLMEFSWFYFISLLSHESENQILQSLKYLASQIIFEKSDQILKDEICELFLIENI